MGCTLLRGNVVNRAKSDTQVGVMAICSFYCKNIVPPVLPTLVSCLLMELMGEGCGQRCQRAAALLPHVRQAASRVITLGLG